MATSPLSRRTISPLCADGVVADGMVLGGKQHLVPTCRPPKEASASKYTLVTDSTKYTGCGACEAACQICNDLPEGSSYIRIMPFPSDHAVRSDEMRLLCHLALNFAAYTCQSYHVQDAVDTIYLERGIKLEGDCIVCHPVGVEPLND